MLRRVNSLSDFPRRRAMVYSISFAFGLSVILILAGILYTDGTINRPHPENRKNIRTFLRTDEFEEPLPQPFPTNADDGSPNIDKILENTKGKIKYELASYNWTHSGAHRLEDLLVESGGKPLRSLILSTWRSGSTFLGEILNTLPGNFYHYEPLLKYEIIQIRGPPQADKALNTIGSMLRCDFNGLDDYFGYGKTRLHQFSHNSRLWDHCRYKKELCFDADFTRKFCRLFPFQSMKIVRLRLRLIRDILEDNELNVKVVLLIRDPRGVMQSRQHRDFCPPAPDCWQPELLCADMISDYVAAGRLLQQYPDRLMVLRYEELALEPKSKTQQLFKFLGLSITPPVNAFLHSHTNFEVTGVSSTFRVSRDVPFRWKNIMSFSYVEKIQMSCREAMELWGYRMAHNASHMASKDFNPLDHYSIQQ